MFGSHRLLYHSTLDLRVIKKNKKKDRLVVMAVWPGCIPPILECPLTQFCPTGHHMHYLSSSLLRQEVWVGARVPPAWDWSLRRNVKRFRGGLVCKAHRHLYHSSLGLKLIKKKKKNRAGGIRAAPARCDSMTQ